MRNVGDERREDCTVRFPFADRTLNRGVPADRSVQQEYPCEEKRDESDEDGEDNLFCAGALKAFAGDIEREGKPVDGTGSQQIRYQKESGNERNQGVPGARSMR